MKNIQLKAVKILSLLFCIVICCALVYMQRNMFSVIGILEFNSDDYDVGCAALFIALPLISFAMSMAFEKIYAMFVVMMFDMCIPLAILGIFHFFSSPMGFIFEVFLFIIGPALIMLSAFFIPFVISNFFVKQGHKVYLKLIERKNRKQSDNP